MRPGPASIAITPPPASSRSELQGHRPRSRSPDPAPSRRAQPPPPGARGEAGRPPPAPPRHDELDEERVVRLHSTVHDARDQPGTLADAQGKAPPQCDKPSLRLRKVHEVFRVAHLARDRHGRGLVELEQLVHRLRSDEVALARALVRGKDDSIATRESNRGGHGRAMAAAGYVDSAGAGAGPPPE